MKVFIYNYQSLIRHFIYNYRGLFDHGKMLIFFLKIDNKNSFQFLKPYVYFPILFIKYFLFNIKHKDYFIQFLNYKFLSLLNCFIFYFFPFCILFLGLCSSINIVCKISIMIRLLASLFERCGRKQRRSVRNTSKQKIVSILFS